MLIVAIRGDDQPVDRHLLFGGDVDGTRMRPDLVLCLWRLAHRAMENRRGYKGMGQRYIRMNFIEKNISE
jgi:hypothetical protein